MVETRLWGELDIFSGMGWGGGYGEIIKPFTSILPYDNWFANSSLDAHTKQLLCTPHIQYISIIRNILSLSYFTELFSFWDKLIRLLRYKNDNCFHFSEWFINWYNNLYITSTLKYFLLFHCLYWENWFHELLCIYNYLVYLNCVFLVHSENSTTYTVV